MRNSTKALSLLIALLFAYSSAIATSPKKILKAANKAYGGAKKLKRIQTWEKGGLVIRHSDGASGEFISQGAKPDSYHSNFSIRGINHEFGFNGKSGWKRDSRIGLQTLTGIDADYFRATAIFRNWRWLDYKKRKEKITSGGTETVSGRLTNIIRLIDRKGVLIRLFFDTESNLLVREEITAGENMSSIDYRDFRPIDGILEPFEMATEIDDIRYTIKFDRIAHNLDFSDSIFSFPQVFGKPLPDIKALLLDLRANEERLENILEKYTYTEKTTSRTLEKDGNLREDESETYQLSFYKAYRIKRLIAKNGNPLTQNRQKKEDKDVEKRVNKIEKRIAKNALESKGTNQSNGAPDGAAPRISLAELLRASRLENPRREVLLGRNVIVFDFVPNPDFDFNGAKSILKFFGKTAGVMWIDEEDKQVARLEAVLADSYKIGGGLIAKLRKGASFSLEKQRINDEIWLPSMVDINLSVRVFLFGGVKVNEKIESFDYRRFETEVEKSRVNSPIPR